jgi:hypothetical protein
MEEIKTPSGAFHRVVTSLEMNIESVAVNVGATGSVSEVVRGVVLSALLSALPLASQAQTPFSGYYPLIDTDVIRYLTTPPNDPVARLQRRLDRGDAKLIFQKPHGYLLSVLWQLNVPLSSQGLVFSKTSSQMQLIGPATPRAVYFNDDVYIGWVQGGNVLEVAATDPSQGTMFYTLDQREMPQPQFARREECLQCHASPKTVGVPGLLLRSVFPATDGTPQYRLGSFDTYDSSPLKERWGGWYVTGTHGSQHHMGNVWLKDKKHPDRLDLESGGNVTSLMGRFNVSAYATPHSDIVALMVLAHQTHLHDLITRVNWETRLALHQQGSSPDAIRKRISNAVEILLRCMLFTDESRLEAPVRGTSTFATEFAALGPKDGTGRSLRDLDLNRRLFRYPCSYLIYSEAFDALPEPALDYFYRRLWEVLNGENTNQDNNDVFESLTKSDREAILSILQQTKPNLPSYWSRPDHLAKIVP